MIKMNDFEQGLANIMGSFMEVNLDWVEKQNQEIEKLQNNWNELKKFIDDRLKEIEIQFEERFLSRYEFECRKLELNRFKSKMQKLEGNNDSKRDVS